MDINKCKNCKLYKLDTLADGEKEHYCHPPIFPGIIAWTIPCKNRTPEDCREILDMCDRFYGNHNKDCKECKIMDGLTYGINHEYFKDKDRIKQVHESCLKFTHELLLNESIVIKKTKETEEMLNFLFYWSLINLSEED